MCPHPEKHPKQPGFTLVEIMIVVVIIGLLAAMAVPAFQRVAIRSQVQSAFNNARQLSNAADQYYMEFGVSTVAHTDIVGADKYVKNFAIAARETYPTAYTQGVTITVSSIAGVRSVTYSP